MRTRISFLVLVVLSCSNPWVFAQPANASFNFDADDAGKLPDAWTAATGTWMIANDVTNKAMKQTARNKGEVFNVCVNKNLNYKNLEMEVRVKALEGNEDRGGGLIWRYRDAMNYYFARANPLENNFKVFRVVNGTRKQLQSANAQFRTGEWFTVKVVITGNTITCYYNGQKLLNITDDTYPDAGQVGFWSKADAVSLFDDFKVKALK